MCAVYQALEIFRCAEAARGGEEAGHMVSERSVVGMFLYGHYLDRVVSVGCDSRQYLIAEFYICAHAFVFLGHTNVAFIDKQRFGIGRELVYFPFILRFRTPYLGRKQMCLGVLYDACGICRNAFAVSSGPVYHHLVQLSVA